VSGPSASRWRHFWLPAAWVVGALLVLWANGSGELDPTGRRRGVNWPGDVRRALVLLTIEVLVLWIIVRPWSYRASWARAGAAFLVFSAWTVLGGTGTLHGGRIDSWHWGWLLVVTVGLLGATVISALTVGLSRRPPA
jgi:hypothetical protein